MAKRARSSSIIAPAAKKSRGDVKVVHNKIASSEAAAKVDANPPLAKLLKAMKSHAKQPTKGEAVVYWMRMEDMRLADNRAISQASDQAQKDGVPLLVLFVLSPEDYVAHDRSSRRIDFTLRNLSYLKARLADIHVPLYTTVHTPRRTLPSRVLSLLGSWKATRLYANIEYEVDELRRDISVCELAKAKGVKPCFVHDKLVVEPGVLHTQAGKPFTVYSPFMRQWLPEVNKDLAKYIAEVPYPAGNADSVREHEIFGPLFDSDIPEEIEGFKCEDKEAMLKLWPEGTDAAREANAKSLPLHQIARVAPGVD
ncbi:hypothetical protein EVG20_g3814 [Dentipellis fragilis]|uniref:Photolyase/cryptochrome alpha/beta domain-containing protein n=1 Tax=Dentipellis fragilis TaxID=205917 RepID=A0A4Y9YYU8_9AGAM|nr:hypothetical protein EVG20_g3814 [Dentipellis fragilis]